MAPGELESLRADVLGTPAPDIDEHDAGVEVPRLGPQAQGRVIRQSPDRRHQRNEGILCGGDGGAIQVRRGQPADVGQDQRVGIQ